MMFVPDFSIPFNFNDLSENSGQLFILNLELSQLDSALNNAIVAESEDGSEFIVQNFSTFYNIIKNFKEVPNQLREKAYKLLLKAFSKISVVLSGILEDDDIDSELQLNLSNLLKMISYLTIEYSRRYQDYFIDLASWDIKSKVKKAQKTEPEGFLNWNNDRTKLIEEIYKLFQLPLKKLWDPPVVDDEFINLFANFCYICMEDSSTTGPVMKPFRAALFQILATFIRRYMHGLCFTVKIVQLLKMHEHLVTPLAQGIVELVKAGCNSVVREIVREIGNSDEQLLIDSGGTRSLGHFLTAVAELAPSAVASATDLLMDFLGKDPPAFRCSTLSVLGEVVQAILTREDLDEDMRATRDSYLDALEEHIHDTNAFVRTRALQVWQKLCLAKAIPVVRLHKLLDFVIGRLGDKSSNVKKQAVQLVKLILECNPFSGQLDVVEITNQLSTEKGKLNSFLKAHKFKNGDLEEDWKLIEPELRKQFEDGNNASVLMEGLTLEMAFQAIANHLKSKDYVNVVGIWTQLKDEFYAQLDLDENDDIDTAIQAIHKIWESQSQQTEIPEVSPEVLDEKEAIERSVEYLEGALEFAKLIDRALPLILVMLDSSAQSDVIEAVSFFTAAYQFGFSRAIDGIRRMLYLVFSKEANIKSAICNSYKELYFPSDSSGRPQAIKAVRNLSVLVNQLNLSQMDALEEVIKEWVETKVMNHTCFNVLFERLSKKIPETSEAHSWAALVLISMIAAEQPKLIRNNLSVLLNEGLGSRGLRNFLFAEYTCRALQKLDCQDKRLSADDEILMRLKRLLRLGLWSSPKHPYFVRFADEAITLVYHVAERPDAFCEELLVDMFISIKENKIPVVKLPRGRLLASTKVDDDLFSDPSNVDQVDNGADFDSEESQNNEDVNGKESVLIRLTRFISLLGTVAAHYIGFLENRILGEFKRRNLAEFERKLKKSESKQSGDVSFSIDKEELEFMRATADDMNAEDVKQIAEEHIVDGDGLLAKFLPLIQTICKNPGLFPSAPLQNAALLTLGMYMQVSSKICDENLQLLVTITEKSPSVEKRNNGLLLLWALQFRFPNLLEPWTCHMLALLKDSDSTVRKTAVRVLTNLIGNEMVKARTFLANLAISLIDEDIIIAQTTRHFFREFAHRGNSLYNVMPTMVSSLTGPGFDVDEDSFQTIMKFLLELVTKDKQQELLVEKLCQYFECATTDSQCRNLAFCLSLLHFSEKALRKILENFQCFGSKLYLAEVYESFMTIMSNAAKNPQKDKNLLDEIQALLKEYREKSCVDHNVAVILQSKHCPPSTRKRVQKRRQVSSDSNDDNEIEEKQIPVPRTTRKRLPRRKLMSSESESEKANKENILSDDELFIAKKQLPVKKTSARISSDSDSGETVRKQIKASKTGTAKKSRVKSQPVEESETDEEIKRPTRSTRKRR